MMIKEFNIKQIDFPLLLINRGISTSSMKFNVISTGLLTCVEKCVLQMQG